MFCNKCGQKLPDAAVFCNQCGYKMPIAEKMDYPVCSKCGEIIDDESKFCTKYGTSISRTHLSERKSEEKQLYA